MKLPFEAFPSSFSDERGRRVITFLLWSLVLLSVLAWAWVVRRQLQAPPVPDAVIAAPQVVQLPTAAELARGLGAAAPTAESGPAQRFQLLGVIAAVSGRGAALIAVDGQPARPFAVGDEVALGFVLQRLAPKEVALGASMNVPATLTLPLPEWQPRSSAATGNEPPAAPLPPSESTAVQPGPRGDQRGP